MHMQWKPVLDFWFQGESLGKEQLSRWWKKDEQVDEWIKVHFAHLIDEVAGVLYESWAQTPEGRLAAIICLDQFPRNCYRGSGRSFQYDGKAIGLVNEGLALGHDQALTPLQRSFFIMPLMHDEGLSSQNRCIALFEALVAETQGAIKQYLSGSLDYARKHAVIIERFGRYPHRNKLLNRESTEEEIVFLQQPDSSF